MGEFLAIRRRIGPIRFSCNVALVLFWITVLGTHSARAEDQAISDTGLLIAGSSSSGDGFGSALALSDQRAVISAPFCDDRGVDAGAVYAYERQQGAWVAIQHLLPPGRLTDGLFGTALGIEGDQLVVGAPGATHGGAVFVYRHENGVWVLTQEIHAMNANPGDRFGAALALRAGNLFVGAPRGDRLGQAGGAVFALKYTAGNWKFTDVLQGSDTAPGDLFGSSLAFDGETLVVGAIGHSETAPWEGGAYLFEAQDGKWEERLELPAGALGASAFFGSSVAVDGDLVAVGAQGESTTQMLSGAVFVFERTSSGWQRSARLKAAKARVGAQFGGALVLEGGTLIVGARWDPTAFANAGAVFLYQLAEDPNGGAWQEREMLISRQPEYNQWFGTALALEYGELLIGAPRADTPTIDAGMVSVWSLQPGERFCAGDGSGAMCPCGNLGRAERGCRNSVSEGVLLHAEGSNRLMRDDLSFSVFDLPPGRAALLVVGRNSLANGAGALHGDGLLCVGGQLSWLGVRTSDAEGAASWWGTGITASGAWQEGDTAYFQVWYRDGVTVSPCNTGFNTSNAYQVTFEQ